MAFETTAYKCKKCGRLEYCPPKARGWHWKIGGEKCDGEWQEGKMVFHPKTNSQDKTGEK